MLSDGCVFHEGLRGYLIVGGNDGVKEAVLCGVLKGAVNGHKLCLGAPDILGEVPLSSLAIPAAAEVGSTDPSMKMLRELGNVMFSVT